MIRLEDLASTPPARPAPVIDIGSLVAPPNFAPYEWQSSAPESVFGSKPPVRRSPDLERILALPRRPRPERDSARGEALIELITSRYAIPSRSCTCSSMGRACITRLNFVQSWALYEIGLYGGLLGFIQVGAGKSILGLLAPLAMKDCRLALLLAPPTLVKQLVREYLLLAQHFRVPSLVVHGSSGGSNIVAGAPVLHVLPYSRFSRPESTAFLEQLKPDTIIADEVHLLRHANAVRTARLLRYFVNHGDTRFLGWSGSVTDSSIKDYAHLVALALRYGSPLPLDPEAVEDWARALDPSDWPAPAGALLELCAPGESAAAGYYRRLSETPGVIITSGAVIDAELEITERDAPEIPLHVQMMLDTVRATSERPDGEILVDPFALGRCLRELAQGIYLRWKFPPVNGVSQKRETIEEWFAARKAWGYEMREKLSESIPHLDSPVLLARAAARAWGDVENPDPNLPLWKADAWPRWRDMKPRVVYVPEAVRVDDYLARDAAEWATTNRGIVWYSVAEFGKWVSELSGLPLHGGGADAGDRIAAEKGDRSIIASIRSHGTGRDGLQFLFDNQLIASPPSSSAEWQQVLGRLHRLGQEATIVRACFYAHTPELRQNLDQALRRSEYVKDTTREERKLLTGREVKL